jgi:hypothetical protein
MVFLVISQGHAAHRWFLADGTLCYTLAPTRQGADAAKTLSIFG